MDFIHDTLASGESIRILSVVDVLTRECLTLVLQRRFGSDNVARCLALRCIERGAPTVIEADNGSEFTSKTVEH